MPSLRKSGPPNAADWGRRNGGGGTRFGEDLARSVHKMPERNDAKQAKWLAERRLEQEHVYALADEYDIARKQNDTYRGALENSERYINQLEAELSNLQATNARNSANPSYSDGGSGRSDPPIRDVQNAAYGGEAPAARPSNEVPRNAVLYDNRTGVADGGREQHVEPERRAAPTDNQEPPEDQRALD